MKKYQDFVNHHQKLAKSMKHIDLERGVSCVLPSRRSERSFDLQSCQIRPSRNAPNFIL